MTTTTEAPTRTRWLLLSLLFGVGALLYIDRVNISIAAKLIMPEYGLSEVQMGWIFSAFVLGYAICQVPGGLFGDRFGPRRVLALAISWWSVFTMVTAVAGEWVLASLLGVVGSFVVVRVLIGLGEAAGPPNHNRVVANWFPLEERALATSAHTCSIAFGAALTPPLVAWLMVTFGWRVAFYLAGGVGVVLAGVWYWLATDRPEEHAWVNAAELRHIQQGAAALPAQSRVLGPVPWRAILGSTTLWWLFACGLCLGYVVYIYLSWFYLYLVNVRGFSVLGSGLYSMAPFLASAVAAPIGGLLSDRLCQRYGKRIGRCGIGVGSMLFASGFIFAGAAAADPYLAVLFLSLGAGSVFFCSSVLWATTIDLCRAYAGTVGGFVNMASNLGGVISPTLTPFLAQRFGWENALYVAAALALLGAFFWLGVHPEQAIELEEDVAVPLQKEVVVGVESGR